MLAYREDPMLADREDPMLAYRAQSAQLRGTAGAEGIHMLHPRSGAPTCCALHTGPVLPPLAVVCPTRWPCAASPCCRSCRTPESFHPHNPPTGMKHCRRGPETPPPVWQCLTSPCLCMPNGPYPHEIWGLPWWHIQLYASPSLLWLPGLSTHRHDA